MKAPGAPRMKRLLLVKFGAVGDVIMAIPAAAAMQACGYEIDWIAGRTVAPILALYPWIRVIAVDEARLLTGTKTQRLRNLLGFWRALRGQVGKRPYDLCATLYYDRRYRLLTLPIRARYRLSLSWSDRELCLLPGRHHTDEYARILLGRPDSETPAHLPPVPAPNLPSNPRPRIPGKQRVVLVPGGARNLLRDDALRRWPVENYTELAQLLLHAGHEVVLVGGPEDQWTTPHFAEVSKGASPGHLLNLIGALRLVETLALLDSADVTVTHDTGPLHLAGLASTAIVTIFGPTDPHGRLPQRANCVALWGGESFACRPCYDGRGYAECSHNGCVREITPAMVLRQVESLLALRAQGRCTPPRVLTSRDLETVSIGAMGEMGGGV